MKHQHLKINFSANGYMDQDILITDNEYSPEDIIKGLQEGYIVTTIQEGGEVVDSTNGRWKIIGTVIESESSLEHRHFDMDDKYAIVVAADDVPFDMSTIALAAAIGEVIPDDDISRTEFLAQLTQAGDRVVSQVTDLGIVERYELLTGNQLLAEVEGFKKGLEAIMSVAYEAGRCGKRII